MPLSKSHMPLLRYTTDRDILVGFLDDRSENIIIV